MRINTIEELNSITDEDCKEFERTTLEFLARERHLEEQGYKYNTDKSYSLKLLNDAGHFPIGITNYIGEETFIFRNKKEASKAWRSHTLGWDGWFHSVNQVKKIKKDDYFNSKIYWLWKKNQ